MSSGVFLLSAARAIVEMLWLCLLAQGALYLLAGSRRESNPLYRLFALIGRGPLALVGRCLPAACSPGLRAVVTLGLLLLLWLGLAWWRRQLLAA